MKTISLIIFVMLFMFGNLFAEFAELETLDINSTTCKQTPEIMPNYLINIENKSNNLRRKTGIPYAAAGEFIKIQGFLMDAACLPITNALIEIWHLDTYGVNKEILPNEDRDFTRHDVNFTGGGKFYTDNMGRFEFLTVMPGVVDDESVSQVNFHIKHHDFPDFYTVMFFPQQENMKDELFHNIHEDLQSCVVAEQIAHNNYVFNVTMMNRNTYKKY